MLNAIRSEWIKLSTLTVNKILIIIAVAFPIVVTALVAGLSDEFFSSADVADLIGGLSWLSALLFGVLAAIGMSGEFNYNTIRPTFAAEPRRIKPVLAKLTVHLVVTIVLVAGFMAAAWLLATNLLDGSFSLSSGQEFGVDSPRAALAGTLLLAVGVTIAGFGLGNLIRNTPATVTALLLWPLVLENVLARLLFAALDLEWGRYLPFTQGLTIGIADRGEDDAELMSRVGAGVYFFAWVIVLAILGIVRTERSDA
jgi:ABC-2 type transport system permease protein